MLEATIQAQTNELREISTLFQAEKLGCQLHCDALLLPMGGQAVWRLDFTLYESSFCIYWRISRNQMQRKH